MVENPLEISLSNQFPKIDPSSFVAESSELIGDVRVGEHSSIWPKVVARGDIAPIEIGKYTNIQDGSVLHVDPDKPLKIGNYVTVGHQANLHGCTIEDEVLIGIGAVVLSGAKVPKYCTVGAQALVTEGAMLEEGFLYLGIPAKKIRALTEEEKTKIKEHALNYSKLAQQYKNSK